MNLSFFKDYDKHLWYTDNAICNWTLLIKRLLMNTILVTHTKVQSGYITWNNGGSRDHIVVGLPVQSVPITISTYHHSSCEFEPRSWRGVLYTTLCDKVCQWPATGQWFSPGTPVSSTNKTDRHNIDEILLKVVLNTINQINKTDCLFSGYSGFLHK